MTATVLEAAVPATRSAASAFDAARRRRKWHRPVLWSLVGFIALAVLAVYAWHALLAARIVPQYVTELVTRGDLTLSVTANGTLKPTRSVDIGSELSGTVARVFVDVNDGVRTGQVLVELDTSKLRDQVRRSRATLASAKAKVEQSVATVKETRVNLRRLQEVARLSGGELPSKTELDGAQATLDRALADEASARAEVAAAEATLATDETNLSKASIRSPIDGVVLSRRVEPGNAVAASLQAVTLLELAEDLTHLRLEVNVDESDAGVVSAGQPATFTVSAYPNRKFPATITKISFGSTVTENVVTYVAYLDVDNSDLSLRPGMTATAVIAAAERHDVLRVPNTALRFTPASESAEEKIPSGGGIVSRLMPRPPRETPSSAASTAREGRQVWILRDDTAVAVPVTTGISDGRMTEVTGGELGPGTQVITDQRSATAK